MCKEDLLDGTWTDMLLDMHNKLFKIYEINFSSDEIKVEGLVTYYISLNA